MNAMPARPGSPARSGSPARPGSSDSESLVRPPRLRLSWRDWLAPLDWYHLLTFAAFWLVLRMPGSFILLLVLPAVVIVARGLRVRTGLQVRALWRMIGWCLVTALASVLLLHREVLTSTGNNLVIMTAVALNAAAVCFTGQPSLAAKRMVQGIYAGLCGVWAISMAEAATGFKLLPILYPAANTIKAVTSHRFYVTATYPNYNDYSIAMAMLAAALVARMVFGRRPHVQRSVLRLVMLLSATGLVAYMGSRGALAGLVLMVLLVLALAIRAREPHFFSIRKVFVGGLLTAMVAVGLITSPYVMDNSTMLRGVILSNTVQLMSTEPLNALFGYGQYAMFNRVAALAYPNTLMDPHNLALELVIWYGIPGLVTFALLWFAILWNGFVKLRVALSWHTVLPLVIVVALPLLGIVPSSTLRYHLVWLLLITAIVPIAVWRRAARGTTEGVAGVGVAERAAELSRSPQQGAALNPIEGDVPVESV